MLAHFALLAAGSLLSSVAGAAVPTTHSAYYQASLIPENARARTFSKGRQQQVKRATDMYMMYTGNGQVSWPDQSEWIDFDYMFNQNLVIMKGSCVQWNVPNNSDQEIEDIRNGAKKVAAETGVDQRFIFAVLLQESNGCVRAPTTNYGVRNPGLMQDHKGQATCNEGYNVKNPCPAEIIEQMVRDGVAGTPAGDGLKQTFAQAPGSGTAKYYGAARLYNSGTIAASGDLGEGIATHCYASDIANRLMGWVFAQKACTLDGALVPAPALQAPQYGALPSPPQPLFPESQPKAPEEAGQPQPQLQPQIQPEAPKQIPSPEVEPFADITINVAPGVSTDCAAYYTVQDGDYCFAIAQKFGITLDAFRQLNAPIDENCSNLWKDYDYCVKLLK
jgi:hypothetical protein